MADDYVHIVYIFHIFLYIRINSEILFSCAIASFLPTCVEEFLKANEIYTKIQPQNVHIVAHSRCSRDCKAGFRLTSALLPKSVLKISKPALSYSQSIFFNN